MSGPTDFGDRDSSMNRRYVARRQVSLKTALGHTNSEVIVRDISLTGILVESSLELTTGETLLVDLPERGETRATVVWNCGNFFGCEFDLSIPSAVVSAALLRSPVQASEIDDPTDVGKCVPHDRKAEDESSDDHRYSLRARGSVIIGFSVLSWTALVLAGMWLF